MRTENNSTESSKISNDFFKDCKTLSDFDKLFANLFKQGVEALLQGELDYHLGYNKNKKRQIEQKNSRNGYYDKTVKTENLGNILLSIPRDRNASFEPQIIPKGQRMSNRIEDLVVSMYGKGLTTSDISELIKDSYGVELSGTTISNITNRVLESIKEWQNRPLDPIYMVFWMDGIRLRIRQDGQYSHQCAYIIIGLKTDGTKEVLGIWISETESASFWLKVLTDLKARGVQDVCISCSDNLTGLTEAIQTVFPKVLTQLCIVHQIRNSCKHVSYKDRKEFCKELKNIYGAVSKDMATQALDNFEKKWNLKYEYAIKSWKENWEHLTRYFNLPLEIRKVIYTTNTIENMNRGIRKYTKTKIQFVDKQSATKAIFLAIQNIEKSWQKPIQNWGYILHQFIIIFAERLTKFLDN